MRVPMTTLTTARADRPLRQERGEQGKQGEGLVSQSSVIINMCQVIATLSLGSSGPWSVGPIALVCSKAKHHHQCSRAKPSTPQPYYMRHREGARVP